jgi:hypothetical protein
VPSQPTAPTTKLRLVSESRPPDHPSAVWTAFTRQGQWKSWVIAAQLLLMALLTLAAMQLARKPPDIVLVDSDGRSTYLNPSTAGDELTRWLAERRQRPNDVTVAHFSREFLKRFLGVNSTTIQAAWPEALSMMAPALRVRMEAEAAKQKLVETYRAAQVATEVDIQRLELVEQLESAVHVRAHVARTKRPLAGGPPTTDVLAIDLILDVVPRTAATPDGLQLAEYRNAVPAPGAAASEVAPDVR